MKEDETRKENPAYIRAIEAGVCLPTVYKRIKELGRLPTVEECKLRKCGRKRKYNY